jgi:PIN domain-containing protein
VPATVTENLLARAEELRTLLRELLLQHIDLYLRNRPGSGIVSVSGNHAFRPLDVKGRQLQSRLLEEYRHLSRLLRALLCNAPAKALKTLEESEKTIEKRIEQRGSTWDKTPQEAFAKVDDALTRQLAPLGDLYDSSGGSPVYVPDTNALLHNPDLDLWTFQDSQRFTIVLTPAVLSELDRLKVEHRNPDVRAKADALIGRIKSWRSRGDLLGGVTLRRDTSTLKSLAVEPRVEEALAWLDPGNADDRLIAAVIEVMRQNPRAPVTLVTRDINAQNKAAYAGLPFEEPPPP